MHLLAGLGNPGTKYHDTRHNVGFMFLDYLARQHGFGFADSKWQAQVAKTELWHALVLAVKPLTYMNLSGNAIAPLCRFYKIPPDHLLVVHDELDLPLGRVKLVVDRGTGGHNGLRSIAEQLGTRNFLRFRVGIGRPSAESFLPPAQYVLAPFQSEEQKLLHEVLTTMEEALRLLLEGGVAAAMNWLNSRR